MKYKAGEVDRFLQRIEPSMPSVLIYGPDQGLVTERARKAAKLVVDDLEDPFNVAAFEGESLRAAPGRLIEEAQAFSLMGVRRVVRVRQAGDGQTTFFKDLLKLDKQEAFVIVEAGDLSTRSSLRKLFETAKNAAALPCYPDDVRDLAQMIRRMLLDEGLEIDQDALGFLQTHLGSDREVTRREIEKLALFMQSATTPRVTLEDAAAAVGDSSALGLDDLVFSALLGDAPAASKHLQRLLLEGEAPVRLTMRFGSTLMKLFEMRLDIDSGRTVRQVVDSARPPVHFRQKPLMQKVLERWTARSLYRALERTVETERSCKSTGSPDQLLMSRLVHVLGSANRQQERERAGTARDSH